MEQNHNRENLRKLLAFLEQNIIFDPANRWFVKDLYAMIEPVADGKLSDIYELCIEEIIRAQAQDFYKDFVISDIRQQLIEDFIKMEHWRRRNDIKEFGMAMFQQIECIINRLGYDIVLCEVFRSMMKAPCYVDAIKQEVANRDPKSNYTVGQLLYMSDAPTKSIQDLSMQWVVDKFKGVNYFVCHKGMLTRYQFNQFVEENRLFGMLYALRNRNHRGNNETIRDASQLKEIKDNPSRGFLSLTSFFCWFIDRINQGYPLSKALIDFSNTEFHAPDQTSVGPKVVGHVNIPDDGRKRFR